MLPIIKTRNFKPVFSSDFFNDDFDSFFFGNNSFVPAVNIREDEKQFGIEIALPGIKKEDINLNIEKDTLTVSSEIKSDKKDQKNGYTRREFGYRSFCRTFVIPENVDAEKISAGFNEGILTIDLPKNKEEAKLSRSIKIS